MNFWSRIKILIFSTTLPDPGSTHIALGAKSDGLYIRKPGGTDKRLLTEDDSTGGGGTESMITDTITLNFTATNNYIRRQAQRIEQVTSVDSATDLVFRKNTAIVALPVSLTVGDEFTITYTGSSAATVTRSLSITSGLNSFVLSGQSTSPVAIRSERWVNSLINTPLGMLSYGGPGILQYLTSSEYIVSTGHSVENTNPYIFYNNKSRSYYHAGNNTIYSVQPAGTVSIINLTTGVYSNLNAGSLANAVLFDSTNNYILVISNNLTIIDCSTNTIIRNISFGGAWPLFTLVQNGFLYYNNSQVGTTLTKYNIATGTYNTISCAVNSGVIADNGYLYASLVNTYKIDISGATPVIALTISNTSRAAGYFSIFNPNNKFIYIVSYSSYSDVTVVSTLNDSIVTRITVGNGCNGMWLDSANNYLYVCNSLTTSISVIDCASNTVVQTLSTGTQNPYFILEDLSRSGILVCSTSEGNKIYEFNKRIR